MIKILHHFLIFFILMSCSTLTEKEKLYIKQINEWHKNRIERLTEKDGWFSLAGLFWLKDGSNSFGSDESNDIIFPQGKAADFMGSFILKNSEVTIHVKPGINITVNDAPISEMILLDDNTGKETILKYNSLSWYVIKRQDKYGIRLKDTENPALKKFSGIERYKVDPQWKVEAKFFPYDPVKIISIPTQIGTIEEDTCYGYLQFEIDGNTFQLDALGKIKSKSLFLIFADQTNDDETYGAGRFLSVDFPHPDSTIFIDFNKAYNPPCAFTKYATCPLPPKQNILPIRISAGEKKYAHDFH